ALFDHAVDQGACRLNGSFAFGGAVVLQSREDGDPDLVVTLALGSDGSLDYLLCARIGYLLDPRVERGQVNLARVKAWRCICRRKRAPFQHSLHPLAPLVLGFAAGVLVEQVAHSDHQFTLLTVCIAPAVVATHVPRWRSLMPTRACCSRFVVGALAITGPG